MLAVQSFQRSDDIAGRAFDRISDAVDELNVQQFLAAQGKSQFDADKDHSTFRNFAEDDPAKKLYREQHEKQTVEFNIQARKEAFAKPRATMSVWEAMEMLDTLVDASDPDTDATQIEHLLQTAEAMRKDGKPEWMQVTGLIHDLGKLLYFFGSQGQWDVVGDTFIPGCQLPLDKIAYGVDTFDANPDAKDPRYTSKYGIYSPGCGLENVMISWGHDEYLYLVMKDQSSLPKAALDMIRYHSFYPWHREGAYKHFEGPGDAEALAAVLAFNPYDLYSKSDERPSKEKLKPYYQGLIAKFFPDKINW